MALESWEKDDVQDNFPEILQEHKDKKLAVTEASNKLENEETKFANKIKRKKRDAYNSGQGWGGKRGGRGGHGGHSIIINHVYK